MTPDELRTLQPGAIIRHKEGADTLIVVANAGPTATAIRATTISNPTEWDLLHPGPPAAPPGWPAAAGQYEPLHATDADLTRWEEAARTAAWTVPLGTFNWPHAVRSLIHTIRELQASARELQSWPATTPQPTPQPLSRRDTLAATAPITAEDAATLCGFHLHSAAPADRAAFLALWTTLATEYADALITQLDRPKP